MEKKIATFGGNVATLLYNEMVNVKGRLNSRPFCVAMWSTGKDAQKPASAQLLPCLMCTGLRVGVAVGNANQGHPAPGHQLLHALRFSTR